MLPHLQYFKKIDWLLSFFFAAQVHWTISTTQMIQDNWHETFIFETQPATGKDGKINKNVSLKEKARYEFIH